MFPNGIILGILITSVKSCYSTDEYHLYDNDNSSVKPYMNFRLPNFIIPNHYKVFLDVFMRTKEVSGIVEIDVKVLKSTEYIVIHALRFTSLNGMVLDSTHRSIPIKRRFNYERNQYYVMETIKIISPGNYLLRYKFSYVLNDKLSGFYHMKYKTIVDGIKDIAATQLCPIDARTMLPCFDEPNMRATFDITVSNEIEFASISNMPVHKIWYNDLKTRQYTRFEKTPRMPIYLLALVISDFDKVSLVTETKNLVKMSLYAPKNQIKELKFAEHTGSKILSFYEKFFNVTYPLPKADMIVIPNFSLNGMENWGLIAFSMKSLLYDVNMTSLSSKAHVVGLIAHELAHQWFGNLVTVNWWSDIWLNEGFATYVQYIGMNSVFPDWKYMDLAVVNDMMSAMELDTLSTSHPIHIPVKKTSDISQIFDPISYQKGSCILRMLNNFLGNDNFLKGVAVYLRKYSFRNAKTDDLWKELTEVSKQSGFKFNVATIMNTWVKQKGFPLIDVSKVSRNTLMLSQSKFSVRDFTLSENKWIIPFDYILIDISNKSHIIKSDARRVWLNLTHAIINIDSTNFVIKGNAGQYGYFRVNYDEQHWQKLTLILKTDPIVFDVKDRAGLLQDSFALARAGKLKYSIAFDLFSYINKDDEFVPWKAASQSILFVANMLRGRRNTFELIQKFIFSKVSNQYSRLNVSSITGFQKRQLQILLISLACGNKHGGCLQTITKMFGEWMEKGKRIPNDFRQHVYYYGVLKGTEKTWNFVLSKYLDTENPSERSELLKALCATRQPTIVKKLLGFTFNNTIVKSQDVFYVFRYVSEQSNENRQLSWKFLTKNWNLIAKSFGSQLHTLERILEGVFSGFNTNRDLNRVRYFITSQKESLKHTWGTVRQILETIQSNIDWMDKNRIQVEEWLELNVKQMKLRQTN